MAAARTVEQYSKSLFFFFLGPLIDTNQIFFREKTVICACSISEMYCLLHATLKLLLFPETGSLSTPSGVLRGVISKRLRTLAEQFFICAETRLIKSNTPPSNAVQGIIIVS